MTPGRLRPEVIAERTAWIREMLAGIRALPLDSPESFESDPRNVASAESYLRRALEAQLDLGRHVLSKRFGRAPAEYKQIADELVEVGVLSPRAGTLLRDMAGYRNRMVHFYHQVAAEELYEVCRDRLGDIESIQEHLLAWVREHEDEEGEGEQGP